MRKRSSDILTHTIDEILLLGVTAHVLKRKDRYRRLVGRGQRLRKSTTVLLGLNIGQVERVRLIGSDWLFNVLDLARAQISEHDRQYLPDLIVSRTRDTNAPRPRQGLQSRGNVHTVAEQITGAYHHVTDMDANAEIDAFLWWQAGVSFGQDGLHFHCALHRVNGTAKLRKDTIAGRVRYASLVVRDVLIEDRSALREPLERPASKTLRQPIAGLGPRHSES